MSAQLIGRPARHNPYATARLEDYTWLREQRRLSIQQAAWRLGVSQRTAQRYEARRKKREAA